MIDRIYIPTLGRHDNQITYNSLPTKWKKIVTMVVQEKEKHLYKYDCEYYVIGNDVGIAKTRELIYRYAGAQNYIMIDDDLKFIRRNQKYYGASPNMEKSKREFLETDFDDMFNEFENKQNDGIVLCGLRNANLPPNKKQYSDNSGGVYSVHSINGKLFMEIIDSIDFDTFFSCDGMEDLFLNLEILSRGYKIGKFDEFLYSNPSGEIGGCSTYRTKKNIEDSFFNLQKKYFNYIKFDGWKLADYNNISYPKIKMFWNKLLKDAPNSSSTLSKFI